ncbi:DUF2703 domain-containing protein [Actinomadura sp. 7K534]|uniref:DUF2703 domain-containing protein n=1 Tax=Actinomadura sp. 7K534 TaxID=2530366 RepID=UPI001042C1AA|nr:DUF2703 domain-containing protein [Actinomadura sp. 7K534]TDB97014.1 DUF2703 domain-containing protein [Actinomadura sp. 7K534]
MTTTAHLPETPDASAVPAPQGRLAIDYWTVVMGEDASCASCDATLTDLNGAVDAVRPLAERLGITLEVVPRTVSTWEQALEHQITASPTLRSAGLELSPSHPDDSETRLWSWRGRTSGSLPQEAVLDLVLRAVAARSAQLGDYLARGGPSPYIRRFLSTPVTAEPEPDDSCGCP